MYLFIDFFFIFQLLSLYRQDKVAVKAIVVIYIPVDDEAPPNEVSQQQVIFQCDNDYLTILIEPI